MNTNEPAHPKACVICRTGIRRPGEASTTLSRESTTITVHHVPAEVCDSCGEEYFDSAIADRLQHMLSDAIAAGTRLAVLDFIVKVA